jgi:hypothetical protein
MLWHNNKLWNNHTVSLFAFQLQYLMRQVEGKFLYVLDLISKAKKYNLCDYGVCIIDWVCIYKTYTSGMV